MPVLSVVIPTLNEAQTLPILLAQLEAQQEIKLEIIVADGGSKDNTLTNIKSANVLCLTSESGRAKQMNAGAKIASGEYLLFLHADSELHDPRLLNEALQFIRSQDDVNIAGHFALSFKHENQNHNWAFRYLEEKTLTNRRYSINGDQGLLIAKQFFRSLGGFDEAMGFMEDQQIAEAIFAEGRWLLLPGQLVTSGRRFETEGFHRRYILMSLIMGLYWTGAKQFFQRANKVYAQQAETQALQLWPYFRCIWQMLIYDFGWWGSIKQWYLVGRYIRQNSWQLFFFFDVAFRHRLGPGRYPYTKFHDRYFYPMTNNAICNTAVMIIAFVWFMFVLGPYFYLSDKARQ